jgi:glycosyltransferase involved in cell wall biosynthesis
MTIGIDLEQFVTDPFASGVQRVVQYLAKDWPREIQADWIVPTDNKNSDYALLTREQAAALISIPFDTPMHVSELPGAVAAAIRNMQAPTITEAELESRYDLWFLPEVCYTPKVLKRFERIQKTTRTAMIGYDSLPMSDPYNYKFTPGTLATVSEYFRLIATTNILLCISEFTKDQVLTFLRRSPELITEVIHPGGDHIPAHISDNTNTTKTYLRVGTMEARKQPVEILNAFLHARENGNLKAELHFVGAPARVDVDINFAIERAISEGAPVRWTTNASDEQVMNLVREADVFLSYGREGYGIPVLEAIQLGTPVFFDGTQPSAELMQGHGAHKTSIDHAFQAPLPRPITSEDQEYVPTWKNYACDIAQSLSEAQQEGSS